MIRRFLAIIPEAHDIIHNGPHLTSVLIRSTILKTNIAHAFQDAPEINPNHSMVTCKHESVCIVIQKARLIDQNSALLVLAAVRKMIVKSRLIVIVPKH
jgi:hypothetical protein